MTQNAIVTKILDGGMAEVSVERKGACGDNCVSCKAGCANKQVLTVRAKNPKGASVFSAVVIESRTKVMLFLAFMVYLIPIILVFVGYAVGVGIGASEGGRIGLSILFLLIGVLADIVYYRKVLKHRGPEFVIVSISGGHMER